VNDYWDSKLLDNDVDAIVKRFTHFGEFKLSGGGTSDTYVDMREAMLVWPGHARRVLTQKLERMGVNDGTTLVGTGVSGALMLGLLDDDRPKLLWNPKGHGTEWSGTEPPGGASVVLLDDVATTGSTLMRLSRACASRGWTVIGECVLHDTRPELMKVPGRMVYLASPYSGTKDEQWRRYETALEAVKYITATGRVPLSPIVHCHFVAAGLDLPGDWDYWGQVSVSYLDGCAELWVLCMDGWDSSTGIRHEIEYARKNSIPVRYVTLDELADMAASR